MLSTLTASANLRVKIGTWICLSSSESFDLLFVNQHS